MLGFNVIAELGLALYAGKGARLIQCDGMRAVKDRVASLNKEQVQLDGIARIHVTVREEIFASEEDCFALVDALFAQRLGVIYPVDCRTQKTNTKSQ